MEHKEQPRRERITNFGPRNNGYNGFKNKMDEQKTREKLNVFYEALTFNDEWIIKGADKDLIEYAEKAGEYMAPLYKGEKQCLSKSQIRNVYGEIKRIQLKGINTMEGKTSFMLLKPKVAYAEGRNKTMGLSLFKKIFDDAWDATSKCLENESSSIIAYNNFCALLEAILAYHKAYGGQD